MDSRLAVILLEVSDAELGDRLLEWPSTPSLAEK